MSSLLLIRLAIIHKAAEHYNERLDSSTLSPEARLHCQVMVEACHEWADDLTPPPIDPDEL